ncbi:MAG TPA: choice-of-anchor D domain-containing protein, partial [Candidatus Binataceae bacterium]|nr:choice-of-anchor D domain-containing protein [Candidatus Binataceae bacterium]
DVNTTSSPKTVTLTNNNPIQMTLNGISTSNQAIFPFQIEQNTCGSTLAAGASCTLQIVFQPPQNGPFKGSYFVNDNAFESPQMIRLSGSGRGGPVPTRTATPTRTGTPGPTPALGTFPMRAFPAIH